MKKHHEPNSLRSILAGLARTARRTADSMAPPTAALRADPACSRQPPKDKHAREFGMRLQKSIESYARLERQLEALDSRTTVAALFDVLLQDQRQWAALRSTSDSGGLARMASMFESVQQAYLLSLNLKIAPVNLTIELNDGRIVVKEHVPNASPEWAVCWSATADTPDVSQTLVYADPENDLVQIHVTWRHQNSVSLEPSTGWDVEAYPTGATGSARRGTQFDSPLIDPCDGVVSMTLRLTAATANSKPVGRNLWIRVTMGEDSSGPAIDPPTRITVPVSKPTVPFLPGDIFYNLGDDRQRQIRDAMREFLQLNQRMYAELEGDISMPEALDADFFAAALDIAERG